MPEHEPIYPELRKKLIELLEANRSYEEYHLYNEHSEEVHLTLLAEGWELVSMHNFPGDVRYKYQRKKLV